MGLYFFFQAEDGIRDYKVTGVQTCALPISRAALSPVASLSTARACCRRGPRAEVVPGGRGARPEGAPLVSRPRNSRHKTRSAAPGWQGGKSELIGHK